jgi:hypothetical protein
MLTEWLAGMVSHVVQIYSRSYLGEVRSFNRMIKFCQNAQVVVLVTDVQLSLLTPSRVATALDAFHKRPALALLVRPQWHSRTAWRRCFWLLLPTC